MEKLKIHGEYQAYLVRLWSDNQDLGWRASAVRVETGESFFFSSPEKLFQFISNQISFVSEFGE